MSKKTALITGASHGIGKAIAIALAKDGYDVGINYYRNEEGAKDTLAQVEAAGGKGIILKANVGDYDELVGLFEEFYKFAPSIDLMVNNAGVSVFANVLEVSNEEWERITNIDWKATFFGTQFAARNMVEKKKEGVILNVSSNHVDTCFPQASVYGPSKAAVAKFTQNAAMELAEYGIRVITLAPGYTDVWPAEDPIQLARKAIPLRRFAEPEEIADIAVFLASDKCKYMTGNRVTVDGGALLTPIPECPWVTGEFPVHK